MVRFKAERSELQVKLENLCVERDERSISMKEAETEAAAKNEAYQQIIYSRQPIKDEMQSIDVEISRKSKVMSCFFIIINFLTFLCSFRPLKI